MPYITSVAGTVITASWANANIRDQVVTPFADAATRAGDITTPVVGLHTYREDAHVTEYYSDSAPAGYYNVAPVIVGCKSDAGSITSTGVEVALAAWGAGDAFIDFVDGHLYRLEFHHGAWNSGTANYFYDNLVKIKRIVNSTATTTLGSWRVAAGGGSSPIVNHVHAAYVRNQSGSTIGRSLGVSVTKSTGGDAVLTSPMIVVYDLGETARQTADTITALAPVSIT